jgi:hypothetical protein
MKNRVLPSEECKDGYLYQIIARTAYAGVWVAEKRLFIIRRVKSKSVYLCQELHWDSHDRHGTAQPIREICKAPDLEGQELIDFLKETEDDIWENHDAPFWTHEGTDESREKWGEFREGREL